MFVTEKENSPGCAEISIEKKYIWGHLCVSLRYEQAGCSGLVHWDDPEGWDGESVGGGVQDGEHMNTHGGFKSMYGKTNTML